MPAASFVDHDFSSLDSVKMLGTGYKVTPNAVVMRARRLGILLASTASRYLAQLSAEFSQLLKPIMQPAKPVNVVRKYAGREYSRRMIRVLDEGRIRSADFCRVVSLNKIKPSQIGDFRAAL